MARARKTATVGFGALRVEGALISPAKLNEIASLEAGNQAPADYSIPKGLQVKDEVARYFRIGQALHKDFASAASPSLAATTRFVETLLHQVFGFDDIGTASERSIEERSFPIALEACSGRMPVVATTPDETLDQASAQLSTEGRKRSAATVMQDWLNAHEGALWGLACNGVSLRLMRDNSSLTRPAYIEADLKQMFEAEDFASFSILWLLMHATRFGRCDASVADCALEHWRDAGAKAGVAARDRLRDGVENALVVLGNGFLANQSIREALEKNALSLDAYFNELLRLVYRLIFLFVVEDRDVLHPPDAEQAPKRLYAQGYSTSRLRERSIKRNAWDRHGDQWEGLRIAFRALAGGEKRLALPALGGLFLPAQTPMLDGASLSNKMLLEAIFRLAWLRDGDALVPVNWRDMETEELGSVYESLLELTPRLLEGGRAFGFAEGAETRGHARKTTGSYYTPDSLVQALLDTALDPVLDRVEAEADDPAKALLSVTVIDPACGSGHFLLAAARRIATRVARARAGGVASAEDYRHALRDVARACIHGVDRNPMAVELTKVALWIETVEPGKPLGFLDANIREGDSLFGVYNLEALRQGIPDAAYKALTGDDKDTAKHYARLNKAEREGQGALDYAGGKSELPPPPPLAKGAHEVRGLPEDTVEEIAAKRAKWDQVQHDPKLWRWHVAADLYCAAFLTPKTDGPPSNRRTAPIPLTGDVWAKLHGKQVWSQMEAAALDRAREARAFHWPLEFPDVLGNGRGGFDVVIGNPPWERIKLQEQEFFAARDAEIASAPNVTARRRLIETLAAAPEGSAKRRLHGAFERAKREAEAAAEFARVSSEEGGRFPLAGRGDVNTYALFAELFARLISPRGRAGVIVPTGIATDATTAPFFADLVRQRRLLALHDFQTGLGYFDRIGHARFKFCLLIVVAPEQGPSEIAFSFFSRTSEEYQDKQRHFTLSPDDIARINPNTRTAPIFRSRRDAELTAKLYGNASVLIEDDAGRERNQWGAYYLRLIHFDDHKDQLRTWDQCVDQGFEYDAPRFIKGKVELLPVWEAKITNAYDLHFGSFETATSVRQLADDEKDARHQRHRYWASRQFFDDLMQKYPWDAPYLIAYRDVVRATDERTLISLALPREPASIKLPVLGADTTKPLPALLACLNSIPMDYIARQKVGGISMSFFILKQLAVLPPSAFTAKDLAFIQSRVLELTYTSPAMAPFAESLGYRGPPFRWNDERRALLRGELDQRIARLYGLSRDEQRYILDPTDLLGPSYPSETFRVLKENEIREYGEYRTAKFLLQAWDREDRGEVPASEVSAPTTTVLATQAAAPTDRSALPDGAWATPTTGNVLDHTLAQVAAVVKALPGATSINLARRAALYALEPRLLTPRLSDAERAEWLRLVGAEATPRPGVATFGLGGATGWSQAINLLTQTNRLLEDTVTQTWSPGAGLDDYFTDSWPARAAFALEAAAKILVSDSADVLSAEEEVGLAAIAA